MARGRFSSKMQAILYYARKRRLSRQIQDSGADFTFSETLTVGTSSTSRGFRFGSFGALSSLDFDGLSVNRTYIAGDGSSAAMLHKFASDLQYQSYSSLWFKFGTADYIEAPFGSGQYLAPSSAAIGTIWDYLNSEVGNNITLIIEARP